ncbi:hypothetical protein [Methanobrevibacter curvatus]|uniref:Uncharacterized protein n=1 Tax=Methanobrevibacter curvatus TaxID=49547 RepID=A0A162FIB5_9EURY|nr:hypothetical protein [Methanobrevibacter curvatus]KZX10410.1 hypothetical protein MBCUR_17800 [Methanobrevibacter curvatus]
MAISRKQQFSLVFGFILVVWSILPFVIPETNNNLTLPSSSLLFLIGIAYPAITFIPTWQKPIAIVEGIAFILVGSVFLDYPWNILFIVLGFILFVFGAISFLPRLLKKNNRNQKQKLHNSSKPSKKNR